MIVFFEGIDKAGKTTLLKDVVDKISIALGRKLIQYKIKTKPKDSSERDMPLHQYKAIMDLADQNPGHVLVVDRSYVSELVYSGVKRDYDACDDKRYDELLSRDALFVHVTAKPEVIKERFKSDFEEYLTEDDIDAIIQRYDDVLGAPGLNVIRVETPGDRETNAKLVADKIIELL